MKKTGRNLLVALLAIISVSLFTEVVVFNLDYLRLPEAQKGIHEVQVDELLLKDLAIVDGGLVVTGAEPSFRFPEDWEVLDLRVTPDASSLPFSLVATGPGFPVLPPKRYDYHPDYKAAMYLEVHKSLPEVTFLLQERGGPGTIAIRSLTIDNGFSINPLRLFLLLFVGSLLVYFVWFRTFAGRNLHVTFLLVSLGAGLLVVFSTPLNFSFDEAEHFVKAYQVSNLDFGLSGEQPIPWFDTVDEFLKYDGSTAAFSTYREKAAYMEAFGVPEYREVRYIHSTAAPYLPTAYVPSALGILLGRTLGLPLHLVFSLGRFFGLLGYSLVVSFTIWRVKMGKRLVFALGLLPAILYGVSAYTADAMTVAFSLSAVGIYINMAAAKEGSLDLRLPALLSAACAIVVMSKVPYAPLCLLVLAVPRDRFRPGTSPVLAKIGPVASTGLVAFGAMSYSLHHGLNQWVVPGVSSKGQVLFILKDIPRYALILWRFVSAEFPSFFLAPIGNLAYAGWMSSIAVHTVLVCLFFLAVTDNVEDVVPLKARDRVTLMGAIVLSWALVVTSLYVSFNPVGSPTIQGVQGRYFAPLLLPFLLLFRGRRVGNGLKEESFNYAVSLFSSSFALFMALKIFMLYTA